MKTQLLFICTFFLIPFLFAQNSDFQELLSQGKAEFKKEIEEQDYSKAVEYLEQAVALKPKDAEAHYFLGYAYSRLNSKDGSQMIDMRLDLLLKSSEHLEQVIKLSPKYEGDMLVLDPYSKIDAEWGSMALAYWAKNKLDSAKWALLEAKKRGGFGDFRLAYAKKSMDIAAPNAILLAMGDNIVFPLLYLQLVEQYRTDISLVEVGLLNTRWYPVALFDKKEIAFDLSKTEIDSTNYTIWEDSMVSIKNLSWMLYPSYQRNYLLRGDLLLWSILRANQFQRPVYFTMGFPQASMLSLLQKRIPLIFLNQLDSRDSYLPSAIDYEASALDFLKKKVKKINKNSPDELETFDFLRYNLLYQVRNYLDMKDLKNAKQLFRSLERYAGEKKFPYSAQGKEYLDFIRKELEK